MDLDPSPEECMMGAAADSSADEHLCLMLCQQGYSLLKAEACQRQVFHPTGLAVEDLK